MGNDVARVGLGIPENLRLQFSAIAKLLLSFICLYFITVISNVASSLSLSKMKKSS